MERALEDDQRLYVVDRDRALAERAGLVPEEVISEARGLLESGEAMLRQGRAQPALQRLQAAETQLGQHLAWMSKNELARAQFLVGAAQAVLGNRDAAMAAFQRLQVWRPDFVADTAISPAVVLPVWERTHDRVRTLPGGSIEIKSSPDRALAYVDGRFVGFTPTTAEGLAVGDHYVTLRKVGFQRQVERVAASDKQQHGVHGTLEPSPGADDLNRQLTSVAAGLGGARAPAELTAVGETLQIDHLVLVRMPAAGAGKYEAFVYATASRKRLAAATADADPERDIDATFTQLARALYAQVVFVPPPPPRKPPAVAGKRSVWSRWWLWAGIGVAAAAAVAVPLTIDAASSGGPSCPGNAVCAEIHLGP